MDRYIFINSECITIYNETSSNIERYDYYLNSNNLKYGIINTGYSLKDLFTKSEKSNFYKKVKTGIYFNHIFIKKDKNLNYKYLSLEDMVNYYVINLQENIKEFSVSVVKQLNKKEFSQEIIYLTNVRDIIFHAHNGYIKIKKSYIVFN